MAPIIPSVEVLVKMFTNSTALYARVESLVCSGIPNPDRRT
jgi:hypothetical protein